MKDPGLEVGAQGEAVSRLQVALRQAGYRIPQGEAARRFFGPGTRNAITQYQQDHALPVDGRADPATLTLLTASPPPEPADIPGAAATSAPGKADRPSGSVLLLPTGIRFHEPRPTWPDLPSRPASALRRQARRATRRPTPSGARHDSRHASRSRPPSRHRPLARRSLTSRRSSAATAPS